MKLCFISDMYEPYNIGGAENYVKKITMKLKNTHEIILISTSIGFHPNISLDTKDGYKIYRFQPLNFYAGYDAIRAPRYIKHIRYLINLWNPHSYITIKNILKKEEVDIVHTHNLRMGCLSTSTFTAIKSLKILHIHTLHDYQLLSPWSALLKGDKIIKKFKFLDRRSMDINKYLTRSVDVVTAPSKFVLDMHLKYDFFKNAKHIVLPLGIELDNRERIEKDYKIIDILYIGRLVKSKGVHILINVFKELEHKNIRLHICGKGNDEDKLKKIAGSDQRILFHGFVPDEELMKLYQKANVVVVPSIWYDNSPMVIYESLMDGTPIIGSRIGGIPELVEDGYNGFLFEAGNVDDLKEILENLIKNPSELKGLEDNAFKSAKKYDMEEHIKKLEELYMECTRENND